MTATLHLCLFIVCLYFMFWWINYKEEQGGHLGGVDGHYPTPPKISPKLALIACDAPLYIQFRQ